jgi:hypothetical protein
MRLLIGLIALIVASILVSANAQAAKNLAVGPPEGIRYELAGPIGERVDANIDNWLLRAPYANPGMIEMFRVRDRKPVPSIVPWAGEFVGKYLISAIQARRMTDDPRVEETIRWTLKQFLSTQAEDGYLGPFRKDERLLGHWDLWGHYHAILALLMWYEETGDAAALNAAIRAGNLICETYVGTDRRPLDAGSDEMNLAIIHAMGRLYRHTNNDRYLQMMRVVEKDWESAGDYFRGGLAGTDFYKLPRHRWESLHDLQGMVELYRITGNEDYRTAFLNLWESIRRFDRHNTGGFTTNEGAIGNPYSPGAIETCCTTAWSALTVDALYLTGDPRVADELEWSLWNGIIGSQHPTGRWWTYNTPMDGKREASAHTIVFQARAGTPELNCCSVNAPRGIGMISEWGIVTDEAGALLLNYYGPMKATVPLEDGLEIQIEQSTDYPKDGRIEISIGSNRSFKNTLKLRIPEWSKATKVSVNGEAQTDVKPGTYYVLNREWKSGDKIALDLDQSIRTWVGDGAALGKVSLFRGPLLLAFDQKYNDYDCEDIPKLDHANLTFKVAASDAAPKPPMALFDFKGTDGRAVRLCDFASAGVYGTEYLSWLPVEKAPPPPFYLLSPRDGAAIPTGPNLFDWTGPRINPEAKYSFELSDTENFEGAIMSQESIEASRFILRDRLDPDRTYYWRVAATNAHGTRYNEEKPQSFKIDPTLRNDFIDHPALVDFREDGLVAGSKLAGDGEPTYGYLADSRNVKPAEGRDGSKEGAVAFSGEGMLRYRVAYYPAKDSTFLAWVCPEKGPEGRLAQIFSAWAQGGDDPLRVTIEGGKLFARIEGGGAFSTKGYPVEWGKWIHVAAVKEGPRLRLYVNGGQVDETGVPEEILGTTAEDIALGANPHHTGPEFYTGRIQDFAFYGMAMGAEEVKRRFEGTNLD